MAYFAGLRGTGSFGTDERPKEFREMILWAQPNGAAPLFALTSKAKTESLSDPEFSWWEETQGICRIRVNGALNDSVSAGVFYSGALELIEGDLLMVEPTTETAAYSPEILRVTAKATTDTGTSLAFSRGAAGTAAAAIPDGAYLLRVGNAQGEGGRAPGSSSTNPTKFYNYCQIFKTPYQISKSALAIKLRTGDPLKNEQKRKSFQHAEKIEQQLFWGVRSEVTGADGMPLRTTRGIRSFITSNNYVYDVRPDIDTLIDNLAPLFDYDAGNAGNERIAFLGNTALMTFARMARDSVHVNVEGQVKYYGMEFQKFVIPQGTIYVKSHPLLNVHPTYKSSMFVLPGSGIIYRPLKGRDTHIEKDIQENDADYKKDQWLTEAGFEFHHERTWGYYGGLR